MNPKCNWRLICASALGLTCLVQSSASQANQIFVQPVSRPFQINTSLDGLFLPLSSDLPAAASLDHLRDAEPNNLPLSAGFDGAPLATKLDVQLATDERLERGPTCMANIFIADTFAADPAQGLLPTSPRAVPGVLPIVAAASIDEVPALVQRDSQPIGDRTASVPDFESNQGVVRTLAAVPSTAVREQFGTLAVDVERISL
jgi:hypothetical protein